MLKVITAICSVIAIDALILLFVHASSKWKDDGNDDYLEGE